MDKSGAMEPASKPEITERPHGAFLNQHDAGWLGTIFLDGFKITDEWMQGVNHYLPKANELIDNHRQHIKEVFAIKGARTFVFYEFGRQAKSEPLEKIFAELAALSQRPATFIENARLLEAHGINVERVFLYASSIFKFEPSSLAARIEANIKTYGREHAIKLMEELPLTLLGNSVEFNAQKNSALLRLSRLFGLTDDFVSTVAERPSMLARSLEKSFAIARIALEFYDGDELSLSQINTALAQPLDTHMIALIKDNLYQPGRAEHYRDTIPRTERRGAALNGLSPNACKRIGAKVLRAYFRAAPLTKQEQQKYPRLAQSRAEHFREYDQVFEHKDALLTEADLDLLRRVTLDGGTRVGAEWLLMVNRLIRRGSKSARPQQRMKQHNPVVRARLAFLDELGWTNEDHRLQKRTASFLSSQPYAVSPAVIIKALRFADEFSLDPVKFINYSPSFAPTDLEGYRKKMPFAFEILRLAGREELLAKFPNLPHYGAERLKLLVGFTALYRVGQQEPFSEHQLRMIVESPIEAHQLAIFRDGAVDPSRAYHYKRHHSIRELRNLLQGSEG